MEENNVLIKLSEYNDLLVCKYNCDFLRAAFLEHAKKGYNGKITFEIPEDIIKILFPGLYQEAKRKTEEAE